MQGQANAPTRSGRLLLGGLKAKKTLQPINSTRWRAPNTLVANLRLEACAARAISALVHPQLAKQKAVIAE